MKLVELLLPLFDHLPDIIHTVGALATRLLHGLIGALAEVGHVVTLTTRCYSFIMTFERFTDLESNHKLVGDHAVGTEEGRAGEAVSHGRGGRLAASAGRT